MLLPDTGILLQVELKESVFPDPLKAMFQLIFTHIGWIIIHPLHLF